MEFIVATSVLVLLGFLVLRRSQSKQKQEAEENAFQEALKTDECRQRQTKTRRQPPPIAQQSHSPRPTQAKTKQQTVQDLLNQTYRFVALDVETANSDNSSICQIGLSMVKEDGQIHTASAYIDPEDHFADFNIQLHGIDEQTVEDHPTFDEVIQFFRAFLERHPLIQHSNFDKRALESACKKYDLPPLRSQWHDSVVIARHAWPEFKGNGGHGLAHLKTALDLDFDHHDAGEDAKAAATVVLRAEEKTGQSYQDIGTKRRTGPAAGERSQAIEGNQNGPLYGHVACFTGKLNMSRTDAGTRAAAAGITVKANISKKITLLVVGDQDLSLLAGHEKSTKHRRAEELISQGQQIRILGESEFLTLITQTPNSHSDTSVE